MGFRLRRGGRGVRRSPGQMNKLEAKYADFLRARQMAGEIIEWHFEAIKLRLAPKTFYDTDFLVMNSDYEIEIHEVKGFVEDDAIVKLKVAAAKYPFRFLMVKHDKLLGWTWETIGRLAEEEG